MSTCVICQLDMQSADSCEAIGPVDPSVALEGATRRCPDCGVAPGGVHHDGCDVDRCSVCGGQWLLCGHAEHDASLTRWTGEWPGVVEAKAAGYYCRDFHPDGRPATPEDPITAEEIKAQGRPDHAIRWHVPCGPDDPGAHPDLNRLARQRRATPR